MRILDVMISAALVSACSAGNDGAGNSVANDSAVAANGDGAMVDSAGGEPNPPARDRDPARAGGIAVTSDYVRGSWVAKGGDCRKPNFAVTAGTGAANVIETRINGYPATGTVDVGQSPALRWDEGIPGLPIETRGPDGLAVMPPSNGDTVTLAGHRITGDGVVFIKCD